MLLINLQVMTENMGVHSNDDTVYLNYRTTIITMLQKLTKMENVQFYHLAAFGTAYFDLTVRV